MTDLNNPIEPCFTLYYGGKHYVSFPESELLKEGVPASEIAKVKADLVQQKRQEAYQRESDPLYIEWQYELSVENPNADQFKQDWIQKVEQIKARYPLPQETKPAA